jgi:UPF0755 protein
MSLNNDAIEHKITKCFNKIFIIVIIVIVIIGGAILGIFMYNLSPVDKNNNEEIVFTLSSGWGQRKTASELKSAGLIKNDFIFLLYSKIVDKNTYLAGDYVLNKSMSVDDIINSISTGDNIVKDTVVITFVEGKRFTDYADIIEEKMGISASDVISRCSDKTFLNTLIDKYWFITSDILDSSIYYPLEGYLYPNTYEFNKTDDIDDIIYKLLDEMDTHLSVYKDEIDKSDMSIHSLLTLASMVELEAVTAEDRLTAAGVFKNRLNLNMALGSDVTTYYASKKKMTESLTNSQLNECNAYNTRGVCAIKGLPVGPICSPSYTSIIASLNPEETEYLYFVADKNNKLYFSKTNDEQLQVINDLKNKNLWPE